MHQLKKKNLEDALHVISYIKLHPGQGIFFPSHNSFSLSIYCDSDWASCPITRPSTSGYCVLFGNAMVSLKVKKQATISQSYTEVEYRAIGTKVSEIF